MTKISEFGSQATSIVNTEGQVQLSTAPQAPVIYFVDSAFVQGYTLFYKHFIAFFVYYFNDCVNDR